MKFIIKSALLGALAILLSLNTNAASVATGDLGENVVTEGGAYVWSPAVGSLTNALPATLTVVYGLWNDPSVLVHAYVNGTEVGSFNVVGGYFDAPGTNSFSVESVLVEGVNTVRFDGLGVGGDYVVGSITLDYNLALPETNQPPVTNVPPVTNLPPVTLTNQPGNGPVVRKGSSVLHYTTVTPLAPTELGSNVSAVAKLSLKEQGNSARQKLDFTAAHLEPRTDYFLIATIGDESSAVTLGTFRTDKQGRAHADSALDAFPVTDIRTIGIQDAGAQTLALASINTSPSFQYLVKRNLTQTDTNGTAAGSIGLKGNAEVLRFRLRAGGLSLNSSYYLAFNSNIVAMTTSSDSGRIEIVGWPAGAPALLDLRSFSLSDASSNVVLSTTFPK